MPAGTVIDGAVRSVTLTVAAPSVGPGFDVVHAMTQPLFVDGGDLRIGDAALTLVLDDAF